MSGTQSGMQKMNQSMENYPEMTDNGIINQSLENSYYNCICVYRTLGERVNMLSRANLLKGQKLEHIKNFQNSIMRK